MLLALAQLNPVLGDIAGNKAKLLQQRGKAWTQGADLMVTPELYLCGYPPEDLATKPSFQNALHDTVQSLLEVTRDGGPALLVGTLCVEEGKLYNAMLLLDQGQIVGKTFKRDLPNYGPFDEKRIFSAGPLPDPVLFRGTKLGILVCEDVWKAAVAGHLANQGADILLVPNGSPYEAGKEAEREVIARQRVSETGLPLIYLNQIGGQDELVFDGASFVMNSQGTVIHRSAVWAEDLFFQPLPVSSLTPVAAEADEAATVYNALMLGLRDYVTKNSFPGVVLGLSGGIDSAIVAALAVDALGADKVWCVMMPSPYTSPESHEDAKALAQNLACRYDTIPIIEAMKAFDHTLAPVFAGKAADVTEENIQARCRGLLLMALSNKYGAMVLSTGNKSEMSVGYSTLYGDLCGGFAVLKDVYKTDVYRITAWRNYNKPVTGFGPEGAIIPERILTKAPTAELRPNQKDQDSLPPYETLDAILAGLIEKDLGIRQLVEQGFDAATVKRVWSMLDRAEYKRRQAPPGVKITRRYLGKDRRYPITNNYREVN